jgi:hypothetical protein
LQLPPRELRGSGGFSVFVGDLYFPAQLLAIAITVTRESAEPRGHDWPNGHTVLIGTSPLQPHTLREAGRITQWTAFLRRDVNSIKIPAAKLDTVIVLQEKSDHVVWAEASK